MKLKETGRARRMAGLGVSMALAVALLSACSAESEPEPTQGGTLTVANSADAQPAFVLAGRQGNVPWAANVFETLTSYDADGVPQPLLATDWTIAEDGMSIHVELRDDVTFHSGRPFTAEDVVFSFEQAVDPANGSQVAFIGNRFESIDIESDTELTITFAEPLSNIFDFFEQTFIVDSETFAGLQDGSQVIGTGAFLWDDWDPGSEYRLVRNDDYWGDPAFLDEIEVAIIGDSTAMVNAVRSGRVHYAVGLSGLDVTGFQSDPQFTVVETSGSVYPLGMNVEIGLGYLYISHDLAVVREISHRVAVMYKGRIVEHGDTGTIFSSPQDEYTRKLLSSTPSLEVFDR